MKKAGLFSKSGCNWWVTPGSNPSSKEKRANPIYENETQFLREKSPQTLGITGKKHCRTFLFGNDVFTVLKRSGAEHALNYRKDPEILVSLETSRENNYDNQVSFATKSISGDFAEENRKKDT